MTLASALIAVRTLAMAAPGHARRQKLRELARTLYAFRLFRLARLPKPSHAALAAEIARLRRRDRFRALWATEGLGYQFAIDLPTAPRLLGDDVTRDLPVGSLLPLHAGLGLARARQLLAAADGASAAGPILSTLVRDLEKSSATGCEGLAVEAIGVHVRTLLQPRVSDFDRALDDRFPQYRDLFWHGIGRTLYFLFPRAPRSGNGWEGWARSAREAPDSSRLAAARRGFIFALCLVNIREPAVAESFLRAHGRDLDEAVFRGGLVGAALAWHAWTGRDEAIRRLLSHRCKDPGLRWEERVTGRIQAAIEESSRELASSRRLGSLYSGVHS